MKNTGHKGIVTKNYPGAINIVGFSKGEENRAANAHNKTDEHPLLKMGLSGSDCIRIISEFGWPIPTKSSCFFCPFQRPDEWNWIKARHPELFSRAIDLEARFYERKPQFRHEKGLYGGKPLWKYAEGIQQGFDLQERSCWTGVCGH